MNIILAFAGALLACLSAHRLLAQNASGLQRLDSQRILAFLNQSIDWYRHVNVEQDVAKDAGDWLFANDDRQLADQIIRLSFDFALAEADLQTRVNSSVSNGGETDSAGQSKYAPLITQAAKADEQVKQAQDNLNTLRAKLETASARNRRAIESSIAETQSELKLAEARRDMLKKMVDFVGGIGTEATGGGNLKAQIEELQKSIPAASNPASTAASGQSAASVNANNSAAYPPRKEEASGILGLITDLIGSLRKSRTIEDRIRLTDQFEQQSKALRTPLFMQLRDLAKRSDEVSAQPDSGDPAVLAKQKKDLDAMTLEFQQDSAIVLPLTKQAILLDLYKGSLASWKAQVKSEYETTLKNLLMRIGVLAVVLAFVFVLARLWRKAIFRYIHDARRRYQFLLLRRIVIWFVSLLVIAFGFATELGSLATFAGLLTAGVAVALQNVILSVAGYFFLIGKYGVRVGDRVQISGVIGEVIEIGLVRIHLMELGGAGTDAQPTGRVVAFSNSVVFQASGGLFRQIPGTNFIWHQISLTLAPESNFHDVEQRLMSAVDSVFEKYRDRMEAQRKQMQASLSLISENRDLFRPQSRLRVTQTGVEVVIRYPVDLEEAAEIDDRITRALLQAIDREPKLRLVGTATPNLQPVTASA